MKASLETSALFLSITIELKNFAVKKSESALEPIHSVRHSQNIEKKKCEIVSKLSKRFRTISKISILFRNFPGYLEIFQAIWKLSGLSGKYSG